MPSDLQTKPLVAGLFITTNRTSSFHTEWLEKWKIPPTADPDSKRTSICCLAGLTARNKCSSSSASLSTFQKASEVLYVDGVRLQSQSSPATKPPSITSLTPDGAELLLADGRPSGKEKLK